MKTERNDVGKWIRKEERKEESKEEASEDNSGEKKEIEVHDVNKGMQVQ